MSSRSIGFATLAVAIVVALSACGRSTTIRTPLPAEAGSAKYAVGEVRGQAANVPTAFAARVSSALWARLGNLGRRAAVDDGGAYRVDVSILRFRRRSMATRMLFGAMAGADLAEAGVQIVSPDGHVVGDWMVSAYNATALADEDYVANALADEIIDTLLKRGR